MEKKGRLLTVQADHLSGESLGQAVAAIMELGAANVQIIPSITKKNRPGNILLIDTNSHGEAAISEYLARELRVSGYHRIETSHVFEKVTFLERTLIVRAGGKELKLAFREKIIGDPAAPLSSSVESDFIHLVRSEVAKELSIQKSALDIRSMIEARLGGREPEITLEL